MPRFFPESLSKAATIAAVATAIPLDLWLDPAVGLPLRAFAALAFAVAFVCAHRWRAATLSIVTGAGPLLPAVLTAALHVPALNAFYVVWLTALFGALLPRMPRARWELPHRWRLPLGIWALTLALACPVMIVREAGLRLATLRDTGVLDSWASLNTPQVESWILQVVLAQLVALLWLEGLYVGTHAMRAGDSEAGPPPATAHGLWIGTSAASVVGVYQGTVNMSFLSGGIWPGLHRAAGTLLDANAYGGLAAIAGPVAFVSIPYLSLRHTRTIQAAALGVNWAGVWMSGSRTGLVCGALGTLMLVYEVLRSGKRDVVAGRETVSLLAGVVVVVLMLAAGAGAIGPLKRMAEESGTSSSLRSLWTRGGYGSVAVRMIRDYPLTGVGVGSFNWMAPDYWRAMVNNGLPFDNAQNWWRHQLAELGIVASIPILLWSALIAWLVCTRRSPPEARIEVGTLRGLLLGIGCASLLGMPTQNPIVLVAFFYVAARFEALTRPPGRGEPSGPPERRGPERLAWVAGLLIAFGYAGGHVVLARGPLKPSERAARTNRDYVVGAYAPERLPEGEFRWTKQHATFALAAPSQFLLVRYHVEHPDVESHPVKLRISTPCETLVDESRSSSSTDALAIELPDGQNRVVFDTEVSRTWRPSRFGQADTRDLGAAIAADFVGAPSVVASQRWVQLKACGQ